MVCLLRTGCTLKMMYKDNLLTCSVCTCTGTKSSVNSTAQVKVASSDSWPDDGLFAVLDGSRSPKASVAIAGVLEESLFGELAEDEKERAEGFITVDPLQYLTHTFLTVHRSAYLAKAENVLKYAFQYTETFS